MNGQKCCLCSIASGERRFGVADTPFMESQNYIAIPSIGSFIEGWSMIVSKKHQLSLKNAYNDPEFVAFASQVQSRVSARYGQTIMFEHGANTISSPTGCGVDHAHFHVVPHIESLQGQLNDSNLMWKNCDANDIENLISGNDYLFYCEEITERGLSGLLHVPTKPISQFFRRLLAEKLSMSDVSDYKKFPHIKEAQDTYSNLLRPHL